jgi:hypothetical protein
MISNPYRLVVVAGAFPRNQQQVEILKVTICGHLTKRGHTGIPSIRAQEVVSWSGSWQGGPYFDHFQAAVGFQPGRVEVTLLYFRPNRRTLDE